MAVSSNGSAVYMKEKVDNIKKSTGIFSTKTVKVVHESYTDNIAKIVFAIFEIVPGEKNKYKLKPVYQNTT